jgi:hypothetical protein
VISRGVIVEKNDVQEEVYGGSIFFSEMVLFVALIRGGQKNRENLIKVIRKDKLFRHSNEQRIFKWIIDGFQLNVDNIVEYVYGKNFEYVHGKVMPEYEDVLNEILSIGVPTDDEIDKAIKTWQVILENRNHDFIWDDYLHAERVLLAGKMWREKEVRDRCSNQIIENDQAGFEPTLTHSYIFEDIDELWLEKGYIHNKDLRRKLEEFVFVSHMTYIEHILALDLPEEETIEVAILNLRNVIAQR